MSNPNGHNGQHAEQGAVTMTPIMLVGAVSPVGFVWAAWFKDPKQFERIEVEDGGFGYRPLKPLDECTEEVSRPIASWQYMRANDAKNGQTRGFTLQSICMSPDGSGLIVAEMHPLYTGISLARIGPEQEKKDSGLVVARWKS